MLANKIHFVVTIFFSFLYKKVGLEVFNRFNCTSNNLPFQQVKLIASCFK